MALMLIMLVLFALALFYPPAIACLSIFMIGMDTSGVAQFHLLPGVLLMMLYIVATGRTLYDLWRQRITLSARRRYTIAIMAALISAWVGISVLMGGDGLYVATYLSLQGMLGVVFAVAYFGDKKARGLFIFTVAAQLLLAFILSTFPGSLMEIFRAQAPSFGDVQDLWDLQSIASKDSAQFVNVVQLGFYGAIGLILGVYFLVYSKKLLPRLLLGGGLTYLGGVISFFTIERGIWIGALFGLIALVAPLFKSTAGKVGFGVSVVLVLTGVLGLMLVSSNPALISRREHFMSIRDDSYRVPAAINSADFVLTHPIFGANGDVRKVTDDAGGAPHQAFYFFATMYGIPSGLLLLILMCLAMFPYFRKNRRPEMSWLSPPEHALSRAMFFVVISMALTNNMSAGMLGWICLGYACLPWAFSVPDGVPKLQRVKRVPEMESVG